MTTWTIIFFLCGAIQGLLLGKAMIFASESWLFWAIILNNALSQFAITQVVLKLWKKHLKKKED